MPEIQRIDVADLRLDPRNPRLPERLQGAEQAQLLAYLADNAVLDELIESFADNGFFEHEPRIGVRDQAAVTILEGNRRLSGLKILLGSPEAKDGNYAPTLTEPPTAERRDSLRSVPVFLVEDRDEVHRYLGFRHIGGIKTWSAEAKARYLMLETDRAAEIGEQDPFLQVGRQVGSNSLGVRNAYRAIRTLRHARDGLGIEVTDVLRRRFGVWTRCMTAADVRQYIGLNGATSYEQVRAEIESVERKPLAEVIADLSGRGGQPALIRDSRQVTGYGRVLLHDRARAVLRQHRNLEVALQIVDLAELPFRVEDARIRVSVLRDEAELTEWSEELEGAADGLFKVSRSLRRAVQDLRDDQE